MAHEQSDDPVKLRAADAPPAHRRQIRLQAMQILYQIDVRGEIDEQAIAAALTGDEPGEVSDKASAINDASVALARAAWQDHEQADALTVTLAPDWPIHRQPPVDRAIIRLAHYEIASGHAPVSVAINEAIELAKTFGAEQSPSFINGVLDKMAKRIREQGQGPGVERPGAGG